MSLAYCILRTSYKSRELAVLGATIVGGSSRHRETPSIAIVLYDCHVSLVHRSDMELDAPARPFNPSDLSAPAVELRQPPSTPIHSSPAARHRPRGLLVPYKETRRYYLVQGNPALTTLQSSTQMKWIRKS